MVQLQCPMHKETMHIHTLLYFNALTATQQSLLRNSTKHHRQLNTTLPKDTHSTCTHCIFTPMRFGATEMDSPAAGSSPILSHIWKCNYLKAILFHGWSLTFGSTLQNSKQRGIGREEAAFQRVRLLEVHLEPLWPRCGSPYKLLTMMSF